MGEFIFSISYGGALVLAGIVVKMVLTQSSKSATKQINDYQTIQQKEVN